MSLFCRIFLTFNRFTNINVRRRFKYRLRLSPAGRKHESRYIGTLVCATWLNQVIGRADDHVLRRVRITAYVPLHLVLRGLMRLFLDFLLSPVLFGIWEWITKNANKIYFGCWGVKKKRVGYQLSCLKLTMQFIKASLWYWNNSTVDVHFKGAK